MKIEEAIDFLKTKPKKRNFNQTFDIIINLKNIDFTKPENKFSKDVILPYGRGKDINICLIADKGDADLNKESLQKINAELAKALAKKYEFFICEPSLMLLVGKTLGKYLGPKGKMPKPIPPNANIKNIKENLKKTIRIATKTSMSIQTIVGTENMNTKQIKENINAVIAAVEKNLPKGKNQIKNILLKLTMSKPVEIEW